MKKQWFFLILGLAVALVAGTAHAAQLGNLNGQSCGGTEDCGTWHFVNNQTGGAAAGTLTATFTGGTCTVGPSSVLANTQHFNCSACGTLLSASTNLPGRLVLSDFECTTKEPPCEGKDCKK